ncbi:MAG: allantoicase [Elusimicrobia bacterium]|nr:allantoicase [Elusimicrobiota bacterium]
MSFTELIDLAAAKVGGNALACNDDFFASRHNLLKAEKPVFIEDKFTSQGKWMDGWETRRRRTPGHDWCLIRLGLRGVIRGFVADTSYFTGNYPEACSIDACDARGKLSPAALLKDHAAWTNILPKTPLKGGSHNLLPCRSLGTWTHVRLNIFPDGGVARLRVHGDVIPDWDRLKSSGRLIDLAAVENGGMAISQSDMYFGRATNMLMPGRAKNMGDGWETKRRRGPGHDWCVIKLGATGRIEKVEVDTNHFKGNYPDSCLIEGVLAPDGLSAEGDQSWFELLPRVKLAAHKRLFFKAASPRPATHARVSIFPDGGISRLRLYGRVAKP